MGQLAFNSTDGNGVLNNLKDHNGWPSRWTHVIPGNFGGSGYTDLLFYDAQTGDASFYLSDGLGGIKIAQEIRGGWNKGISHIIPGNFAGGSLTDLLFYTPSTGSAAFYVNDGDAKMKLLKSIKPGEWDKGISHIIPGNFAGGSLTDLLFYTASEGSAAFYVNDGDAQMQLVRKVNAGGWRTSWTQIIPGNFAGGNLTDLLFYEGATGSAEFYVNDGNTQLRNIKAIGPGGWNKGITHIIPGNFGGDGLTDLLFYNPNKGSAAYYVNDGDANMRLLNAIGEGGWRKTWAQIIPGNFSDNAYTDLMFYRQLGTTGGHDNNGEANFSVKLQRTPTTPANNALSSTEEKRANHVCSVQRRNVTANATEHLLLDPQSSIIWPGSLVLASSVTTGEYKPALVPQDRLPLKITISHLGGSGASSEEIAHPELATVKHAIDQLYTRSTGSPVSARITSELKSIYSKEHFSISVKGHYKEGLHKLTGSFDFSSDTVKNKLLLDFRQVYYTISVSTMPSDFFESPIANADDDIAYVSSVTYGRMLLFMFESTDSVQDLKAAIGYAFGNQVDAKLKARYEKTLKESTIRLLALGGDPQQASKLVLPSSLADIKKTLKDYVETGSIGGRHTPPVPLSYKLSYLSDGAVANVVLSTSYKQRNCQKSNGTFSVKLKKVVLISWDDPGELGGGAHSEEIYGSFEAKAYSRPGELIDREVLWRRNRDNYVQLYAQREHKNFKNDPSYKSAEEINQEARFTFNDFHKIRDTGFIELVGEIKERDFVWFDSEGVHDDNYGNADGKVRKKIYLKDAIFVPKAVSAKRQEELGENHPSFHDDRFKLQFHSGNARVEVWFEINPVE